MPQRVTHVQLAAQLLRDAATFFTALSQQNDQLRDQMVENATVFRNVADLIENNPLGYLQQDDEN